MTDACSSGCKTVGPLVGPYLWQNQTHCVPVAPAEEPDRLAEIKYKNYSRHNKHFHGLSDHVKDVIESDVQWLIAALEEARARAEIKREEHESFVRQEIRIAENRAEYSNELEAKVEQLHGVNEKLERALEIQCEREEAEVERLRECLHQMGVDWAVRCTEAEEACAAGPWIKVEDGGEMPEVGDIVLGRLYNGRMSAMKWAPGGWTSEGVTHWARINREAE
jgi:hypothetical protein